MEFRTEDGVNVEIVAPSADMEPLEYMLRTIDARLHPEGWNQEPRLFAVALAESSMLTVQTVLMPPQFGEHPPTALPIVREVLQEMKTTNPAGFADATKRMGIFPFGYVGSLLVFEGWAAQPPENVKTHEELVAWRHSIPQNLADYEHRKETRSSLLVLHAGEVAMLTRTNTTPETPPAYQRIGAPDKDAPDYVQRLDGPLVQEIRTFVAWCYDNQPLMP